MISPLLGCMIKITSTILISGAIALEFVNFGFVYFDISLPGLLAIVMVSRIALFVHSIEAMIAWFLAPSKGNNRWQYGIYTFFVGTIGLMDS
jgi:Domain of unknown function (DUF4499)